MPEELLLQTPTYPDGIKLTGIFNYDVFSQNNDIYWTYFNVEKDTIEMFRFEGKNYTFFSGSNLLKVHHGEDWGKAFTLISWVADAEGKLSIKQLALTKGESSISLGPVVGITEDPFMNQTRPFKTAFPDIHVFFMNKDAKNIK